MESLLPSEVARLVHGYLTDLKCSTAAQIFLESCPLLSECLTAQKCKKRFTSRVHGHSLLEIINDHCDSYSLLSEKQECFEENIRREMAKNEKLSCKLKVLFDSYENNVINTHISSKAHETFTMKEQVPFAAKSVVTRSIGTCTESDEIHPTESSCEENDNNIGVYNHDTPEETLKLAAVTLKVPPNLQLDSPEQGVNVPGDESQLLIPELCMLHEEQRSVVEKAAAAQTLKLTAQKRRSAPALAAAASVLQPSLQHCSARNCAHLSNTSEKRILYVQLERMTITHQEKLLNRKKILESPCELPLKKRLRSSSKNTQFMEKEAGNEKVKTDEHPRFISSLSMDTGDNILIGTCSQQSDEHQRMQATSQLINCCPVNGESTMTSKETTHSQYKDMGKASTLLTKEVTQAHTSKDRVDRHKACRSNAKEEEAVISARKILRKLTVTGIEFKGHKESGENRSKKTKQLCNLSTQNFDETGLVSGQDDTPQTNLFLCNQQPLHKDLAINPNSSLGVNTSPGKSLSATAMVSNFGRINIENSGSSKLTKHIKLNSRVSSRKKAERCNTQHHNNKQLNNDSSSVFIENLLIAEQDRIGITTKKRATKNSHFDHINKKFKKEGSFEYASIDTIVAENTTNAMPTNMITKKQSTLPPVSSLSEDEEHTERTLKFKAILDEEKQNFVVKHKKGVLRNGPDQIKSVKYKFNNRKTVKNIENDKCLHKLQDQSINLSIKNVHLIHGKQKSNLPTYSQVSRKSRTQTSKKKTEKTENPVISLVKDKSSTMAIYDKKSIFKKLSPEISDPVQHIDIPSNNIVVQSTNPIKTKALNVACEHQQTVTIELSDKIDTMHYSPVVGCGSADKKYIVDVLPSCQMQDSCQELIPTRNKEIYKVLEQIEKSPEPDRFNMHGDDNDNIHQGKFQQLETRVIEVNGDCNKTSKKQYPSFKSLSTQEKENKIEPLNYTGFPNTTLIEYCKNLEVSTCSEESLNEKKVNNLKMSYFLSTKIPELDSVSSEASTYDQPQIETAEAAHRVRTVLDITMKHNPKRKCPEYKSWETEVKKLTFVILADVGENEESGKKLILSSTPTHELLILRPHRKIYSTDQQIYSLLHTNNRSQPKNVDASCVSCKVITTYLSTQSSQLLHHHSPQHSRYSPVENQNKHFIQPDDSSRHRCLNSTSLSQFQTSKSKEERMEREMDLDNGHCNSEQESVQETCGERDGDLQSRVQTGTNMPQSNSTDCCSSLTETCVVLPEFALPESPLRLCYNSDSTSDGDVEDAGNAVEVSGCSAQSFSVDKSEYVSSNTHAATEALGHGSSPIQKTKMDSEENTQKMLEKVGVDNLLSVLHGDKKML